MLINTILIMYVGQYHICTVTVNNLHLFVVLHGCLSSCRLHDFPEEE